MQTQLEINITSQQAAEIRAESDPHYVGLMEDLVREYFSPETLIAGNTETTTPVT